MTDFKLSKSQTHDFRNTHCLDVEDVNGNLHRLVNTAKLHVPIGTGDTLKRQATVATFLESVIAKREGAAPVPDSVPEPALPFSSPESILYIHPDADYMSVDVDMVKAVVSRTQAMIEVLDGYYQTPVEHRPGLLNDYTVSDYLWQVSGNLRLIEQIVDTSSTRDKATPKGQ